MESQTSSNSPQDTEKSVLHLITPLSKYIATALYIILPFVGGWFGYSLALKKVTETENAIELSKDKLVTHEQVIQFLNSVGYFRLRDNNNKPTNYVVIGNKNYSLEGADPYNGGQYSFKEIPDTYTNSGGQGGGNFFIESHSGASSTVQLGIADKKRVYYESNLLEGIDYDLMVVDVDNYNVRDNDSVFFLQSNCYKIYFIKGELNQIGTYKPRC